MKEYVKIALVALATIWLTNNIPAIRNIVGPR